MFWYLNVLITFTVIRAILDKNCILNTNSQFQAKKIIKKNCLNLSVKKKLNCILLQNSIKKNSCVNKKMSEKHSNIDIFFCFIWLFCCLQCTGTTYIYLCTNRFWMTWVIFLINELRKDSKHYFGFRKKRNMFTFLTWGENKKSIWIHFRLNHKLICKTFLFLKIQLIIFTKIQYWIILYNILIWLFPFYFDWKTEMNM